MPPANQSDIFMNKLSLRLQLILIICIIMMPLCVLLALANTVSLKNAEDRLTDAYANELKAFARSIDAATEKIRAEAGEFHRQNYVTLSRETPIGQLAAIHLVDELRRIWRRSDFLSGAYLKLGGDGAALVTHNDSLLPIHEVDAIQSGLASGRIGLTGLTGRAGRTGDAVQTVRLADGGRSYWFWHYAIGRATVGFFVQLEHVASISSRYIHSESAGIRILSSDGLALAAYGSNGSASVVGAAAYGSGGAAGTALSGQSARGAQGDQSDRGYPSDRGAQGDQSDRGYQSDRGDQSDRGSQSTKSARGGAVAFTEELAYADNAIQLLVLRRQISDTIPFTVRLMQFAGILGIVLIPALWLSIKYIALEPLRQLDSAMKEIEREQLDYRLPSGGARSLEMMYIHRQFNSMVQQIQDLRIEKYETELQKKEIEATNLRLQINPHLLLNSLNLISSLAKLSKHETIQKFAKHLAAYFRYTLRNPNALVALADELDFVKNYLEMQKIRYPGNFTAVYSVGEALGNARIPSLLIQNFVENAIKHALKLGSEIEIAIIVRSEAGCLVVSVADHGNGLDAGTLEQLRDGKIIAGRAGRQHIGIWNVRRRLQLQYGDRMEMRISSRPRGGTQIWIKIPMEMEGGELA
jgi:signal transduction histidine kinase